MRFPEAISHLLVGDKVRRSTWQHPGVFLYMCRYFEKNNLGKWVPEPFETASLRMRAIFGPPCPPSFLYEDLAATDWEVTVQDDPGVDDYYKPRECPCRAMEPQPIILQHDYETRYESGAPLTRPDA